MGCWTTRGYVAPGDIPLIRSLVTSSTHRRGTFCWNYAMNGQYTVRYWVARNLLKTEEDMKVLEFGITKLQSFAWKVTSPQKICHLMWQLITGHVVVMRNLNRRNMRCDNYFPRYGQPEQLVLMPYLNALQLYKYGPYLQHHLALTFFCYQVFMPIWITSSGERIALLNQNWTWILIPR